MMLAQIQLVNARLRDIPAKSEVGEHGIDTFIVDGATLYALAESLYPFARRETEGDWRRGVTAAQVRAALNLLGFPPETDAVIDRIVQHRWPNG